MQDDGHSYSNSELWGSLLGQVYELLIKNCDNMLQSVKIDPVFLVWLQGRINIGMRI